MINIENDFMNDKFKEILEEDRDFTTNLFKIRPINSEQSEFMIFIGGKAVVPYRFDSESDAQYFLERNPYSITFGLIAAMIDANNKLKEQNNNNETIGEATK